MVYTPNPIYSAPEPVLKPQTYSNTVREDVANWVQSLRKPGSNTISANTYTHGATVFSMGSYAGGVYSPTQNRIYFVPRTQSNQPTWHYINCDTGTVVAYDHGQGATVGPNAYRGGCYSPTENRIYLVPQTQGNPALGFWHYIDCNVGGVPSGTVSTGLVVAYAAPGNTVLQAYIGGVYSPTQNRIYFVPHQQAPSPNMWHYVNCNTGTIVSYAPITTTGVANAYLGGVYSPTQNRIYFVPFNQSIVSTWHYVDCNTGAIVEYIHGASTVTGAYQGGAYSPTQNRIYFVPFNQSSETNWHYIDCNTGAVVAYTHPGVTAVLNAYFGGVYSPTQNRIYFVPHANGGANPANLWQYIDCDTGTVVSYTSSAATAITLAYGCGIYSPTENRIYLIPYNQSTTSTWNYIDTQSSASTPKTLMSGALFNKY